MCNVAKKTWILILSAILLLSTLLPGCAPEEKAETVFSLNLEEGDPAYINIVSISPVYKISDTHSMATYSNIVCRCTTDSGETVWLYIDKIDYTSYIDPSAEFGRLFSDLFESVGETTFPTGLVIHGTARDAESLCTGLSEKTSALILKFESADKAPTLSTQPEEQPEEQPSPSPTLPPDVICYGYLWGTSFEEIKKAEITEGMKAGLDYGYYDSGLSDFAKELVVDGSLLDHYFGVHYDFDKNDQLVSVMPVLGEVLPDTEVVELFVDLVDHYTDLYGSPKGSSNGYDRLKYYNIAAFTSDIAAGKIQSQYLWTDKDSNQLIIACYKGDQCIELVLLFNSKDYAL